MLGSSGNTAQTGCPTQTRSATPSTERRRHHSPAIATIPVNPNTKLPGSGVISRITYELEFTAESLSGVSSPEIVQLI